ncbi:MAG: flagellar basal-body rod protein FlgG [Pseudomonadales bacterium]
MNSALWISKTGLSAQDVALRTISNNLANVSTVGYKRDRANFEDLMYQIRQQPGALTSQNSSLPTGTQLGLGVRVVDTQKEFSVGTLQTTEQPLDLAIEGRGFFQITLPDGGVGYTRTGTFHLNENGVIVNADGYELEPAITVPDQTNTITIGVDGTVSANQVGDAAPSQIGTIQLVDFTNPAGLEAAGGNLYRETASSGAPTQGTAGEGGLGQVIQGALESSNVNVVEELVNMVATQRAYEINSRVVSTADQMLQYVTQNI